MRLKLLIAYDGGPWRGWQSQRGGATVQDEIAAAAGNIAGHRVVIHGAGRTDAGVHASGQCAHCDVDSKLDPARWVPALNAHLPPSIRIVGCRRVPEGFHARFSARGKVYRYRIWNGPVLSPFEMGRAWHVPQPIDLDAIRKCLGMLIGTHDFAAFAANRGKREPRTVRTIHEARVTRRGPLLAITYEGDGFLYKMVRLMTGAVARCGLGKEEPGWIGRLLEGGGRTKCQYVAPAEGLTLVAVRYGGIPAGPHSSQAICGDLRAAAGNPARALRTGCF
jgi:tRNA pseudouridine38-40 synthase